MENQENKNNVHSVEEDYDEIDPENRADVISYDKNEYQVELINRTMTIYHDEDIVTNEDLRNETFVLYEIPESIGSILHERLLFQDTNEFDVDWYTESVKYVNSLSRPEAYILRRYTRHGDEIINKLIRDPDNFDTDERVKFLLEQMGAENRYLFAAQILRRRYGSDDYMNEYFDNYGELFISEDTRDIHDFVAEYTDPATIRDLIEEYIDDLSYIIRNAPKLKRQVRVFRGVKQDYMRDKVEVSATLKGFISTTLDPQIMNTFGRRNVHEIILGTGTPCIAMNSISVYPGENEILLDLNLYAMAYYKYEKFMLNKDRGHGEFDTEVFFDPSHAKGNPLPEFYSRILVIESDVENTNEAPAQGGRSTMFENRENRIALNMPRIKQNLTRSNRKSAKSARYTRTNRRKMNTIKKFVDETERKGEFWKVRENADPIVVDKPVPPHIDKKLRAMLAKFIH